MSIASLSFLVFLPIVLLLCRIFPHRMRWIVLLVSSYIFFGFYNPILIFVLLGITLVSYVCARKTKSAYEKKMKKVYTAIPIIASLGALFVFKYFDSVYAAIESTLSFLGLKRFELDLIVPIGISFIVLRAIMYAVQVYREETEPEKHIGYFALYLAFFPTLFASPLEKPSELIAQLKTKKPQAAFDSAYGLKMLAIGLFKVLAVARQIYLPIDRVFANSGTVSATLNNGFTVLIAGIFFFFQIYCEFSGYCDIAQGISALIGIKLSKSFNAPYLAIGVKDMQSRFNITLNKFFCEYVYAPMGGYEDTKVKAEIKLAVVFLLVGIWYGAGLTFIIFGLVHYIARLVCELLGKRTAAFASKKRNKALQALKWLGTFVFTVITFMLFRASSLRSFGDMMSTLLSGWGGIDLLASIGAIGMTPISIITALLSIAVVVMLDRHTDEPSSEVINRGLSASRAQAYITLAWAIAIAWLAIFVSSAPAAFEYFKF